jgi:CTP:molybdopterin cytidylyltransferase MocA
LAVITSHRYAFDRDMLRALRGVRVAYLGVLGPLTRTRHILAELVAADGGAQARDALLLAACDQWQLTAQHLGRLMACFQRPTAAAGSQYAQTCGIPALFGAAWFPHLLSLRGDRGAGSLLHAYAATQRVPWPGGAFDLDTEQDLARMVPCADGH